MLELRERAKNTPARIIFPEGEEPRIIQAIKKIRKLKIAYPIILTSNPKRKIPGCEMIDRNFPPLIEKYAQIYYSLRKNKGVSISVARKLIRENPVFLAALMVREGEADGFIAGASHTTKDVAKAVIHCMKIKRNRKYISSLFLMITPAKQYGYNGKLIFADCGVIINPNPEQLKEIAIESAIFMKEVFHIKPKVALLSYSTYGSSGGESVEKVREALNLIKEEYPHLEIDGELQVDAALDRTVAKIKCPQSKVAGKANILIFPNLDAGNISYKLVQRFSGAKALGPLFTSLQNPCSDLSRGCSSEEIVDVAAIISIRAHVGVNN